MKRYLIWSHKHEAWRGQDPGTYTQWVGAAGLYSPGDAVLIIKPELDRWRAHKPDGGMLPPEVMVDKDSSNLITAVCIATVALALERG